MSLYDWLLGLHVLSAFALVAAEVLFTFFVVGAQRLDAPGDVVRLFRLSRVGDVLVSVGALGVLVFGIWLAFEVDDYSILDGWIIAAVVLWAVFGLLGQQAGKLYYAARDRARALAADGRDAPTPELTAMLRSRRGLVLHVVTLVVVFLLLADMVWKPGA